jgi:hypothetical protein
MCLNAASSELSKPNKFLALLAPAVYCPELVNDFQTAKAASINFGGPSVSIILGRRLSHERA